MKQIELPIPIYRSQDYTDLYSFSGLGIKVVRERPLRGENSVNTPADAYKLLAKAFEGEDREYFCSLLLDARNQVMGIDLISIGTLNASLVHPRETYRLPVILSAASIICAHNHPSGDTSPSRDDLDLTDRLRKAGQILGIELLDSVILGRNGEFLSFKERGLF